MSGGDNLFGPDEKTRYISLMSTMPSRAELKKNLKLLKERLEFRPMDLDARMRIARTYRLLDDATDAVAHYGAVARYLSLAGHPLQAIAVLKELLQVDPRHAETLLFLAKLYARTRAADPSNRGRVAVPIVVDSVDSGDAGVHPLTDGLPMTATGIWRAIRPAAAEDLAVIHSADDIGAVVDDAVVEAADVEAVDEALGFEEEVLSRVPLFASLDAAAFVSLSHSMMLARADVGEVVFREGEPGDSCLVIVKGEAVVTRSHAGAAIERNRLGPGDVAGLFALVRAEARQATLTAATPLEYFEIDRSAVEALLDHHPAAALALATVVKDRLVDALFREVPLFAALTDAARAAATARFTVRVLSDGDELFDAFMDNDGFWLILDGALVIGTEDAEGRFLAQTHLQAGDWVACGVGSTGAAGVIAQAVGRVSVASLPHVTVHSLFAGEGIQGLGPARSLSSTVRSGSLRR
jgi:CRP-like cAMP-binding protein